MRRLASFVSRTFPSDSFKNNLDGDDNGHTLLVPAIQLPHVLLPGARVHSFFQKMIKIEPRLLCSNPRNDIAYACMHNVRGCFQLTHCFRVDIA